MPDGEKTVDLAREPGLLRTPRPSLVQLHLWTRPEDLVYLRQIAAERDQTVSAVVRSIVRAYRRSRTVQAIEPDKRSETGTATVRTRYIQP